MLVLGWCHSFIIDLLFVDCLVTRCPTQNPEVMYMVLDEFLIKAYPAQLVHWQKYLHLKMKR